MIPSRCRAFEVISYPDQKSAITFFLGPFSEFSQLQEKNKSAFWISAAFRLHQCQPLKPEVNAFCWRKNTYEWMMKLSLMSGNRRQIILCPIEGLNSAFLVVGVCPVTGKKSSFSLFLSQKGCSSSLFPLYNVFCFHLNRPLCNRPNWLTLVDCPVPLYVFAVTCVFVCMWPECITAHLVAFSAKARSLLLCLRHAPPCSMWL